MRLLTINPRQVKQMLRKTIQQEILNTISKSSFTLDDFTIDFQSTPHSQTAYSRNKMQRLAKITFKHESGYNFLIIENKKYHVEKIDTVTTRPRSLRIESALKGPEETVETKEVKELESNYDIQVSPGNEKALETDSIMSLKNIGWHIKDWLRNLEEELAFDDVSFDSTSKFQTKLKETLAEHLKDYIDDKESRFNDAEVTEISEKMDEFVKAMSEIKELKSEIKNLKEAVKDINKNLKLYKKGTWFETTLNRLSQCVSGAKNLDALINTVAKISENLDKVL